MILVFSFIFPKDLLCGISLDPFSKGLLCGLGFLFFFSQRFTVPYGLRDFFSEGLLRGLGFQFFFPRICCAVWVSFSFFQRFPVLFGFQDFISQGFVAWFGFFLLFLLSGGFALLCVVWIEEKIFQKNKKVKIIIRE